MALKFIMSQRKISYNSIVSQEKTENNQKCFCLIILGMASLRTLVSPYGDYDNAVVKTAKKCGYYTIQWDVDSLDWKDYGVDSIIKTVTQHKALGNGSIILCHNGAKYTAQALDSMITTLKEAGYTFVPLSELIYKDNYHMNHEGRQIADK